MQINPNSCHLALIGEWDRTGELRRAVVYLVAASGMRKSVVLDLRADRLLSVYLFGAFAVARGGDAENPIPILMYHSIDKKIQGGVHPYFEVVTSPEVFRDHMRFLAEEGYASVDLRSIVEMMQAETGNESSEAVTGKISQVASRKKVVLTFDDGYRDFIEVAFPILERYSFSATVFLPTAYVSDNRRLLHGRECLTWEEVRELRKSGVSFGSHSVEHVALDTLREKDLVSEIERSKNEIEQRTGEVCEGFCCPYAFPEAEREFVGRLRRILQLNGYRYGVTTTIGRATTRSDPFFLERIPVNDFDDRKLFGAKLRGGYDWLHTVQRISKTVRWARAGLGTRRRIGRRE